MAAIMRPERPENSRNVFSAKPERAPNTREKTKKKGKRGKTFHEPRPAEEIASSEILRIF